MAKLGKYDTALQMFVVEGAETDLNLLSFLRWLGEHGRLEHPVYDQDPTNHYAKVIAEGNRRYEAGIPA
jgi:hypothetical protein